MKEDNNDKSIEVLKVDGGASQNKLLMQIQADLLQVMPYNTTKSISFWSENVSFIL